MAMLRRSRNRPAATIAIMLVGLLLILSGPEPATASHGPATAQTASVAATTSAPVVRSPSPPAVSTQVTAALPTTPQTTQPTPPTTVPDTPPPGVSVYLPPTVLIVLVLAVLLFVLAVREPEVAKNVVRAFVDWGRHFGPPPPGSN